MPAAPLARPLPPAKSAGARPVRGVLRRSEQALHRSRHRLPRPSQGQLDYLASRDAAATGPDARSGRVRLASRRSARRR